MAVRIAEHITQKLIMESIIEEDDRELYCYGFFLLTTQLFFFLVTAATGLIAGVLLESILFYTVFMLLRTFAGGLHAKTETACTILTTLALTVSVFGIKFMRLENTQFFSVLILISSSLSIFLLAPLDNRYKPLTKQEKKHYQITCYAILALSLVSILFAKMFSLDILYYPITWGIFLEGILLCIGKKYNSKR